LPPDASRCCFANGNDWRRDVAFGHVPRVRFCHSLAAPFASTGAAH
jgi:hypothetical protein